MTALRRILQGMCDNIETILFETDGYDAFGQCHGQRGLQIRRLWKLFLPLGPHEEFIYQTPEESEIDLDGKIVDAA